MSLGWTQAFNQKWNQKDEEEQESMLSRQTERYKKVTLNNDGLMETEFVPSKIPLKGSLIDLSKTPELAFSSLTSPLDTDMLPLLDEWNLSRSGQRSQSCDTQD